MFNKPPKLLQFDQQTCWPDRPPIQFNRILQSNNRFYLVIDEANAAETFTYAPTQ